MKLATINGLIDECTSVGIMLDGQLLLAKNRDRTYFPTISIVHEIVNGTELAYMFDSDTDYSEGLNEHGIAIVNTTMSKRDADANTSTGKANHTILDGKKIRHALSHKSVDDVIKAICEYKGGVSGHTTIAHPKGFTTVEKLKNGKFKVDTAGKSEIVIRTNHGLNFPNHGDQTGKDRESSVSRYHYANKEVRNIQHPQELLNSLRKRHHQPGFLEPFRVNYKYWTTSQIMMNISKLELTMALEEGTKYLGITNKLPPSYKPKINVSMLRLSTDFKISKIK